ncbi:MAG: hypothetical protein ACQEVA_09355 [Myxococcota bacterium]
MKRTLSICSACLMLGGVACSESSPAPEQTQTQQVVAPEPSQNVPEAERDPDFDPASERAVKKTWQERHAGQTQLAEIDWEAVERETAMDVALGEDQRETLERAEVPVLLPDNDALLESATYTAQDDWYAAAMEGDGVSVYVSGTREEFVHPSIDARKIDEQEPRITQNELIMTMAFKRWGAAYTVEVECARPSEDSRCEDEGYIREVGRSLGLAGGLR